MALSETNTNNNPETNTEDNKKRNKRGGIKLDLPRILAMINNLMNQLEIGDLKGKGTLGDLLKLLQLYQDLSLRKAKRVEVRWVDQLEREQSPEK